MTAHSPTAPSPTTCHGATVLDASHPRGVVAGAHDVGQGGEGGQLLIGEVRARHPSPAWLRDTALLMSELGKVKQAVAVWGKSSARWATRTQGRQAAHAVRVAARRRRHTNGSRQSRPTSTVAIIHSSQASGLNAPPAKWLEPSTKVYRTDVCR
jgi:hypothetical protein